MGSPFAEDARRAMDKVLVAMPPERRDRARSLAARVATMAPEGPTDPDVAAAVREALDAPRVLELECSSHEPGEHTRPAVEPLGLITVRGGWILVGWCRLRGGVRGFLTDRILSLRITEEGPPRRRPDPLEQDLSRWDFRGHER
ncbi:helix-turn-helix transcriptional regulator [Brachybacterium sp. AOP43-C2-M15]|uniref:helix-turn-helix transcriptional regulator n=1 Tax=Brachybacterium sp. AOP43-C2-M15 TaxID=3457661 RepID=UPI0040331BFD